MSRLLVIMLGLGLFIGFTSCDAASSGTEENADDTTTNYEGGTAATDEDLAKVKAMQETNPADATTATENKEAAPQGLTITTTAYAGIQPNDAISAHGDRLMPAVMRNGEGTFEVYFILDEKGRRIGYAQPNYENEKLLGDIVITSPDARTPDGIRIGSTYGDLRKKYPGLEVHGSEIEGRVYARYGNLYYRLDTQSTEYNLDPNSIDEQVKVTEITLSDAGGE